jgi:pimeloyl-ACP methyl ester carboxylesterase
MSAEFALDREGVRIAGRDFGGSGPGILLLHGLAGYSGEWTQTAGWLSARGHVVALDARGHGESERVPSDTSRPAQIADTVFAIEQLDLAPVILVGHSLGGQLAFLVAAAHPELVRAVVIADGGPSDHDDAKAIASAVRYIDASLRRWPVPFATRDAAVAHFGGGERGEAWASGLERREDGLWPRFEIEVMLRTLRDALEYPGWESWERIECPVLLVRAKNGIYTPGQAREMADRGRNVTLVELPGGHDIHLDNPGEWRQTVERFLDSLE